MEKRSRETVQANERNCAEEQWNQEIGMCWNIDPIYFLIFVFIIPRIFPNYLWLEAHEISNFNIQSIKSLLFSRSKSQRGFLKNHFLFLYIQAYVDYMF